MDMKHESNYGTFFAMIGTSILCHDRHINTRDVRIDVFEQLRIWACPVFWNANLYGDIYGRGYGDYHAVVHAWHV